jgi:hypothetical protein
MKIKIELEVSSRAHNEEALTAVRDELRKRALAYVFDAVENAKFGIGDGRVDRTQFHVAGSITLEN